MKLLVSFLVSFALIASAIARPLPVPKTGTYVHDYTNTLTDVEIRELNYVVAGIEKNASVQLVVLLVSSTNALSIEAFANQIGKGWKVGEAKNGIVYVVDIPHRKQRLEIADSIRKELPDSVCSQILLETHTAFRQKNYAQGIQNVLDGIKRRFPSAEQAEVAVGAVNAAGNNREGSGGAFSIVLNVVFGFILFILFIRKAWSKRHQSTWGGAPASSSYASGFGRRGLFSRSHSNRYSSGHSHRSGWGSSSGGSDSGASSADSDTDSRRSSGGSSGGSGFSGGGASDSW